MLINRQIISLITGILLLFTIGLPVYLVHCSCSGETRLSVLIIPETCEDQNNTCCDTHSTHADHLPKQENCPLHDHHCDKIDSSILLMDKLQDFVISANNPTIPTIPMLSVLFSSTINTADLFALPKPDWEQETSPTLITASRDFLNIICQRKIPACA